jgi:phosphatidylglycerophosphatase A
MSRFSVRLVATFGFIGCLPLAPGTWASLVTVGLWWAGMPVPLLLQIAVLAVVVLVGTLAAHRAESFFGHDDRRIVIDEVAGSLLAVVGMPATLGVAVAGFALFRLFDIAKPPPVYQLQALPGGWGVMADDVAAGLLANLVLRGVLFLVPALGGATT